MPLYDYQCQTCDHTFRKMKRIAARNEPTEEPCPECGHSEVTFVVGSPALAYNQPGIYKTSNNFNDRLKEIKQNVGNAGKDNMSNAIR